MSRKIPITSLPNEILVRIVKHLDCSNLLSTRMTCRTLHAITKTREVWRTVVRELQNRGASPLEEEASNYTTEELEQWSLRRSHTRSVLTGSAQPSLHQKLIDLAADIEYPAWDCYYGLTPGGRWLIFGQPSKVVTFDLDSDNPESQLLFDHYETDEEIVDREERVIQKLWVDRLKPHLSIRFVVRVIESQEPRAHIYRVEPAGHGPGAVLIADRPTTLRGLKDHELVMTLNEDYFVEVLEMLDDEARKKIAIYYYSDALESIEYSGNPSTTLEVDGNEFLTVEFIHANMFAYHTGLDTLCIFEVVSGGSGSTNILHSVKLLHTIPFTYGMRSDIHWSADVSRIVLVSEGDLKGCLLPHDRTTPVILELTRLHPTAAIPRAIGVSATLFLAKSLRDPSEIVTYYWDSISGAQPNRYTLSVKIPRLGVWTRPIAFDEEVGRLVSLETAHGVRVSVVDLV